MGGGKEGGGGKAVDYFGNFAGVVCAGPATAFIALIVDGKTIWPNAPFWEEGKSYAASTGPSLVLVIWGGRGWKCVTAHTATAGNQPSFSNVWEPYKVVPDVSGQPLRMMLDHWGAGSQAWFYWGTSTQNHFLAPPDPKGVAPDHDFAAKHPAYRHQCWMFFRRFLFGRQRQSVPTIKCIVERKPVAGVVLGAASDALVNGQANPVLWQAECLTNQVWGLGRPSAVIDVPSWTTEALDAQTSAGSFFLSPVIGTATNARSHMSEVMKYRFGWWRWGTTGKVELGRFLVSGNPTFDASTTLDYHDLVSEPEYQSETFGDTRSEVRVSFKDGIRGFKESSEGADSGWNREVSQRDDMEIIEAPFITRRGQAREMAGLALAMAAKPGLRGTLETFVWRAAAIREGSLFLFTHDAMQISVICRCIAKTFAAPPSDRVTIEFETERGLAAGRYQPTPSGIEVESEIQDPEEITLFEVIQPPTLLTGVAETHVICLAARTQPVTTGLSMWMRQADGVAYYDLHVNPQTNWAVYGTLSDPYSDALPVAGTVPPDDMSWTLRVELHADTVAVDIEKALATQTADAVDDGSLLLWIVSGATGSTYEITTIIAARLVSGLEYEFQVRRAQFGTPQRNWSAGARVFIVNRTDIVPLRHDRFDTLSKTGATAFFRLQAINAWGEADVAALTDVTYIFSDRFSPVISYTLIQRRTTPTGAWTDVVDFDLDYDPTNTFRVGMEITDADKDLKEGRLVARMGTQERSLWAGGISPTGTWYVEALFALPEGDWAVWAIFSDVSGRVKERQMHEVGTANPVILQVRPAVPTSVAVPVASPFGDTYLSGSYPLSVTLTCATVGASIRYVVTTSASPPARPFGSTVASGASITVSQPSGGARYLHMYATAGGSPPDSDTRTEVYRVEY